MTIKELRLAEQDLKDAWFEFFISEVADREGMDYIDVLKNSKVDFNKVAETIETQGYWSGVNRNYYWSPELLSFITEGRF
jgi:hypothetical protein